MKFNNLYNVLIIGIFFISACSIEKREYLSGFHISKSHKIKIQPKEPKSLEPLDIVRLTETPNTTSAKENKTEEETNLNSTISPFNNKTTNKIANQLSSHRNTKPTVNKTRSYKSNQFFLFNSKQKKNATNNFIKNQLQTNEKNSADDTVNGIPIWLIIILCIFLPPLAVGFATNWDALPIIINVILWFLFILPAIIHAFIVVFYKR
jgi:uncharacterized membrane protein YqaE (UPF0057 family)